MVTLFFSVCGFPPCLHVYPNDYLNSLGDSASLLLAKWLASLLRRWYPSRPDRYTLCSDSGYPSRPGGYTLCTDLFALVGSEVDSNEEERSQCAVSDYQEFYLVFEYL